MKGLYSTRILYKRSLCKVGKLWEPSDGLVGAAMEGGKQPKWTTERYWYTKSSTFSLLSQAQWQNWQIIPTNNIERRILVLGESFASSQLGKHKWELLEQEYKKALE